MTTTFRRSAVASILLAAMLLITSGGLAAERNLEVFCPSGAIYAPGPDSAPPDTVYGGPPKPDRSGDPDDPDKTPPLILFYIINRFILLGR